MSLEDFLKQDIKIDHELLLVLEYKYLHVTMLGLEIYGKNNERLLIERQQDKMFIRFRYNLNDYKNEFKQLEQDVLKRIIRYEKRKHL